MTAAGSLGKIAHETPTLINEATRLTAASNAILLKCRRRAAARLRRGVAPRTATAYGRGAPTGRRLNKT
ncbi:hypothetical protein GCM10010532_055560 [Dactylosporangium siamense]